MVKGRVLEDTQLKGASTDEGTEKLKWNLEMPCYVGRGRGVQEDTPPSTHKQGVRIVSIPLKVGYAFKISQ